ncbi:phosphoribosyltransferase family protein [Gordonia sp. LSe1-13]|uniref:Phosphoribosyltransferase family protein n=1 Tax=Gordonia sesuvii TaxID=3116777 RepID=A0ABU7MHF0_9ACTN|nr:phosphoribosyltransferase family protein [Gordonia sp. LSe1-13]
MSDHIFAGRHYRNRVHAGRILADHVERCRESGRVVVLALPRGGVPVARQVAEHLDVPLDVFLVRKVGVPDQPELAAGAIASGGVVVLNDEVIKGTGITDSEWNALVHDETAELERRADIYRGACEPVDISGATVIIVDDGIATGATMRAAVRALRQLGPAAVAVAVPVGPPGVEQQFPEADRVICPTVVESFRGVCAAYDDYEPLSDAEVRDMLSHPRCR